ncbi:MAG TPA: hypothetical protein VFF13_03555, partial [archaeon]|nr:hypothetical protein [archaeon]
DPNEVAGSSVQTQIDNIGSPAFKNVTFENGSNLTSKTIADQSKALSPDQICVGVSEDVPNAETDFVVNGTPGAGTGTNIVYDGAFTQKARILVYCDSETDIDGDGGINDFTYNFELPSFDDCSFGESSSRACIVIVVPGI